METFSALLAICEGNHRSPVNSPHKGQWRGTLIFSLICAWINGCINNHEAGDLRPDSLTHTCGTRGYELRKKQPLDIPKIATNHTSGTYAYYNLPGTSQADMWHLHTFAVSHQGVDCRRDTVSVRFFSLWNKRRSVRSRVKTTLMNRDRDDHLRWSQSNLWKGPWTS